MADLGVINTVFRNVSKKRVLPVWRAESGGWPGVPTFRSQRKLSKVPTEFGGNLNSDQSGVIGGSVRVGAVPAVGVDVTLFHRRSKLPLAKTLTDSNGEFQFTTLYKNSSEYFAVAFSPTTGEAFNALIYDNLTPV